MRLVKELKNGKKFEVTSNENNEITEPLDIELFESLRKKHDL